MMLVSDVSLIHHDFYRKVVEDFAQNLSSLNYEFSRAWYHLASHDMGPASRCIGPFVPPPQSWQHPLPAPLPSDQLPNWDDVKKQILEVMRPALPHPALTPDTDGKSLYYGAAFIKLAWQCAATFRRTDYRGGCNGARVRIEPQASWPVNRGMDAVLKILEPVKKSYSTLSWADLIVFASHVAIEDAAAAAAAPGPNPFCPGRTDAPEDDALESLQVYEASHRLVISQTHSSQPIIGESATDMQYRDAADLLGLTLREMVALHGRVRSSSLALLQGYNGSWSQAAASFGNQFYVTLLAETWQKVTIDGVPQYKASGKDM
jgi:catalase-peroxidase